MQPARRHRNASAVPARVLGAIGYLWAAPTTAAGLLFLLPMWALGQVAPRRWSDGVWEWSVVFGSRFWRRYTQRGWAGTTLGFCVMYSPGKEHVRSVAIHERRHVWQALWLGPLFFPVYGLLFLFTGYHRHPMERDAVRWEEKQLRGRAG